MGRNARADVDNSDVAMWHDRNVRQLMGLVGPHTHTRTYMDGKHESRLLKVKIDLKPKNDSMDKN